MSNEFVCYSQKMRLWVSMWGRERGRDVVNTTRRGCFAPRACLLRPGTFTFIYSALASLCPTRKLVKPTICPPFPTSVTRRPLALPTSRDVLFTANTTRVKLVWLASSQSIPRDTRAQAALLSAEPNNCNENCKVSFNLQKVSRQKHFTKSGSAIFVIRNGNRSFQNNCLLDSQQN